MKYLLLCINCLTYSILFSATPNWSVTNNTYDNSMTITGIVRLDGIESATASDMVAAFCGDECRGTSKLIKLDSQNRYFAYLLIKGNNKDQISLKMYDSTNDKIVPVSGNILFEQDKSLGSQDFPYIFSQEIIDGKTILSATILDTISGTINYESRTIVFSLPQIVTFDAVPTLFTVSDGANMTINDTLASRTALLPVGVPASISIMAQNGDQSNWTVAFTKNQTSTAITADELFSITNSTMIFNEMDIVEADIIGIDGRILVRAKYPQQLSLPCEGLLVVRMKLASGQTVSTTIGK